MTTPDWDALRKRMRRYDESELVEIVAYQRSEYKPEAVKIAEEELMSRGFASDQIRNLRRRKDTEAAEYAKLVSRTIHEIAELDSDRSYCHLCAGLGPTAEVRFGLAAVVEKGGGLNPASAGLAALTLPLLGVGILTSRREVDGTMIPLTLRLCSGCESDKRFLGTWDLSENDYSKHPGWPLARSIGFDCFLDSAAIKRKQFKDISGS